MEFSAHLISYKSKKKPMEKPKTQKDYRAMYDYRQNLIDHGERAHSATCQTAEKFNVTIMTVYNAMHAVRSKIGGTK